MIIFEKNPSLVQSIIITLLLFAVSLFVGIYISQTYPQESMDAMSKLGETFGQYLELDFPFLFLFIFLNNFLKTLGVMILGFFWGIIPFLFILVNGLIVGIISYIAVLEMGFIQTILSIIPHGIFEIPAAIMSAGAGIWLGMRFFSYIVNKASLKEDFLSILVFYFQVVFPLLLIAAAIEAFLITRA